jgi:putative PIN family toxin of toxin-antitoxin system
MVSAILGGGSARVLDLWRADAFDLVVTSDILHEYLTVLRRPKFKLPTQVVDDIGAYLYRRAIFVTPQESIKAILDDPEDDRFLEAAVAGEAEAIVSGDHHLLDVGTFRGIRIIRIREFLDMVGKD